MHKTINNTVAMMAYPFTMAFGLILLYLLSQAGVVIELATYIAIVLASVLIILFEFLLPYEKKWRPNRNDYATESTYLVVVQIAVTQLVTAFFLFTVYEPLQNALPGFNNIWPHDWPVFAQFIALFLLIDFIRYWLHRGAHEIPFLWRFHAIHHSVKKMFWLNTVRFHPIEKTLQLSIDTIPFILLGVDAMAFAFYYVFFSLNGFFQHSNTKLRFGVLNYIISTADLHRWHHSRLPEESNTNYGNNLIIWDLIFGSYFLPKDRRIQKTGLLNEDYPMDFISQLKTPFIKGLDKISKPLPPMSQLTMLGAISIVTLILYPFYWIRLRLDSMNPESTQDRTLRKIIHHQKHTLFGRQHRFPRIRDYRNFSTLVPSRNYEEISPWVDQQMQGNKNLLTHQQPERYVVSSGTTAKPKYIPLTRKVLSLIKREQRISGLRLALHHPLAFTGKLLCITSANVEGHTEEGIPYGSTSGLLETQSPAWTRRMQVLPPGVSEIKDYEARYYVILCFSLLEKNISYIGTANPGTLTRLMEVLYSHRHRLADSLLCGILPPQFDINERIEQEFHRRCVEQQTRIQEIAFRLHNTVPDIATLWPHVSVLNTWTAGSCGVAIEGLRKQLPAHCKIVELGLIASETRMSFALNAEQSQCLPNLQHVFFEFVHFADAANSNPHFYRLHELEQGEKYYIFITTFSGLYRYSMNDVIEVQGHYANTPTFSFVQKGQGFTNISGEKLHEYQLIQAMETLKLPTQAQPHLVLAIADVARRRYRFVIDSFNHSFQDLSALSENMDRILSEINIEYREKRKSERLCAPEIISSRPGLEERIKTHLVNNGQREGQYKPRLLWYHNEFPHHLLHGGI